MILLKKFIIAVIILGPALYFGEQDNTVAMALGVVAGSLVVAFWNIDKFEFIKGAGFEAKIKAVNEAYATLDNVRKITATLIAFNIDTMTYHNRIGGMPEGYQEQYEKEMNRVIGELNLQKDLPIRAAQRRNIFLRGRDCINEIGSVLMKKKLGTKMINGLITKMEYEKSFLDNDYIKKTVYENNPDGDIIHEVGTEIDEILVRYNELKKMYRQLSI